MSETHVRIDPDDPQSLPEGRIDHAVLDGTTETDLALQQQQDDTEAMRGHGAVCAPGSQAPRANAG